MVEKHDIVYILKKDIDSEELKYSIRSVVENFPYRRIIFYCGCPNDIKPDVMVPFEQEGFGKINKVIATLKEVMNNDDISEDFWLFNDDFFVMHPYETGLPWINGSLMDLAMHIAGEKYNSRYVDILKWTDKHLKDWKRPTLSYATHTPMLINREKANMVLKRFEPPFSFRSVYGNFWGIPGTMHKDIKITDNSVMPDDSFIFLSTNDDSFKDGLVGEYIREKFPKPSKYEIACFEEKTYCNVRE